MEYQMEELVPIVAELAKKYCGMDSSSISYEKAEQLMEAVLYCMNETRQMDVFTKKQKISELQKKELDAKEVYLRGREMVEQRTRKSLALYHEILDGFDSFGNYYLQQTFMKGMPEFFKWYDVKFAPQDTILTLDYPVLADLSTFEGIDAISRYLYCISLEQKFLRHFNRNFVIDVLKENNREYKDMVENICTPVLKYLFQ